MISASALEAHGRPLAQPYHDGYLMKPIDVARVLEQIGQLLRIEWQHAADAGPGAGWTPGTGPLPSFQDVEEMIQIGEPGHVNAIRAKLERLAADDPAHAAFAARMRGLIDDFDFHQYAAVLKMLHPHDAQASDTRPDGP